MKIHLSLSITFLTILKFSAAATAENSQGPVDLLNTYFLDFFFETPLAPSDVKSTGPIKYLVSGHVLLIRKSTIFIVILAQLVPSIFIFIHLLRRIPINHYYGIERYLIKPDRKQEEYYNIIMKNDSTHKQLLEADLYFFRKWNNYIPNSEKLLKTFEHDFDPVFSKMTWDEYLKEGRNRLTLLEFTDEPDIDDL